MATEALQRLIRDVPDFPGQASSSGHHPLSPTEPRSGSRSRASRSPFTGRSTSCSGSSRADSSWVPASRLELGSGSRSSANPASSPRRRTRSSTRSEYGTDSLEIHRDAIGHGARVLLVDDLRSPPAVPRRRRSSSWRQLGGDLVAASFLIELAFLKGRSRLGECVGPRRPALRRLIMPLRSTFKQMMNEVVGYGSCCECGSCVLVCPHNVIEYVDGKPRQTAKASARVRLLRDQRGDRLRRLCTGLPPALPARVPARPTRSSHPDPPPYRGAFGRYRRVVAARSTDPAAQARCQDGGVVTTASPTGFEKDLIDGAAVSVRDPERPAHLLAEARHVSRRSARHRRVLVHLLPEQPRPRGGAGARMPARRVRRACRAR